MPTGFPTLDLPVTPPYPPMEARAVTDLSTGSAWLYEPKWDSFRCLAFRSGGEVALRNRRGFSGGRFRHGTRFLRWRPDKAPRACTRDQLR